MIIDWIAIGEFFKTYGGLIISFLGLIPVFWFANANKNKILQDIRTARTAQLKSDADASEKYRSELAKTVEENFQKSETLATLKQKITDLNIELSLEKAARESLSNVVASEKAARTLLETKLIEQDKRINQLTIELEAEKGLRATAQAELKDLKAVSDKLSEEHTKKISNLLKRIKVLEDELRKHDWPIPNETVT